MLRTKIQHSHNCQGQTATAMPFFGKCCFQGIYFVPNIFFFGPRRTRRAGFAETPWLTHAVKNAWANRRQSLRFAGLKQISRPAGGD
jgi:hypothetical protein